MIPLRVLGLLVGSSLVGAIDGLIVRLTLALDGTPLMMDTIHAWGSYQMFFPADGVTLRPDAPADEEPAFVQAALPPLRARERLVVRIASATHYVTGVACHSRAEFHVSPNV
jgi:hypothetical protein